MQIRLLRLAPYCFFAGATQKTFPFPATVRQKNPKEAGRSLTHTKWERRCPPIKTRLPEAVSAWGTTAKPRAACDSVAAGFEARHVTRWPDWMERIIGVRRMQIRTSCFSIDVAATKAAPTVLVLQQCVADRLSDLKGVPEWDRQVNNRTISFCASALSPPGIDGLSAGPFFKILYTMDLANPSPQEFQSGASNTTRAELFSFVGVPDLFRNGRPLNRPGLVERRNGVDQDDYVNETAGPKEFEVPRISERTQS